MRFEFNDDSQKICNSADVVNYGIQCDICGNKVLSVSNINGKRYCAGCYYKTFMKDNQKAEIDQLKQKLVEKDKEIKDLKEWQDWYSMWHKQFQKQIEDLTTELETYRPTKLHGNGQCECYKCKIECRQPIHWTDWCSKYKGHIYCDDCLKKILKEEQIPQTQLAIQELEKVKEEMDLNGNSYCEIRQGTSPHNPTDYAWFNYVKFRNYLNQQIKELKGEKECND